jgi:hypothetical protein
MTIFMSCSPQGVGVGGPLAEARSRGGRRRRHHDAHLPNPGSAAKIPDDFMLRSIFLKGGGPETLRPQAVALTLWGMVALRAATS